MKKEIVMKKIRAQFYVFSLWSGLIALIILLILFFTGNVQWWRLFDALNIAFFSSLAAVSVYSIDWRQEAPTGEVFFVYFFMFFLTPFVPLVAEKVEKTGYPLVTWNDDYDFFFWISLTVLLAIIWAIIKERKHKRLERLGGVITTSLAAIWAILLAVCLWYSLNYGIAVSFIQMIIVILKSLVTALCAIFISIFVELLIKGWEQIKIGLQKLAGLWRKLVGWIIGQHRLAFTKEGN